MSGFVAALARPGGYVSAAIFARCAPGLSVRRGEPPKGGATRTFFYRGFCPSARATRADYLGFGCSLKWGKDFFCATVLSAFAVAAMFHVEQSFFL